MASPLWKAAFKKFHIPDSEDHSNFISEKEKRSDSSVSQPSLTDSKDEERFFPDTNCSHTNSNLTLNSENHIFHPSNNDFNTGNSGDINKDESVSLPERRIVFKEILSDNPIDEFLPLGAVNNAQIPIKCNLTKENENVSKTNQSQTSPKNEEAVEFQKVRKKFPRFRQFKSNNQKYKISDFDDAGINIFKFSRKPSGIHFPWKYDPLDVKTNSDDNETFKSYNSNSNQEDLKSSTLSIDSSPFNNSSCLTRNISKIESNSFDNNEVKSDNLYNIEMEPSHSSELTCSERSNIIRMHFYNEFERDEFSTGIIAKTYNSSNRKVSKLTTQLNDLSPFNNSSCLTKNISKIKSNSFDDSGVNSHNLRNLKMEPSQSSVSTCSERRMHVNKKFATNIIAVKQLSRGDVQPYTRSVETEETWDDEFLF